jgi:pimeloyl-[acyl-carrier protein] synthase
MPRAEPVEGVAAELGEGAACRVAQQSKIRELQRQRLRLIAAADQGYPLSEEELVGMAVLLAVAGHETTTHLIGNGVLALLRHSDELSRFRTEPGLLPSAVEELARYDGPVQRTWRITTTVVELGGRAVPAGALVVAVLGAANRDPARFPEPDRLDLSRTDNAHLAFGAGVHHCLGVTLARLETAIAIGTLLRRMPRLRLATETPEWRGSSLVRGLPALPVAF